MRVSMVPRPLDLQPQQAEASADEDAGTEKEHERIATDLVLSKCEEAFTDIAFNAEAPDLLLGPC